MTRGALAVRDAVRYVAATIVLLGVGFGAAALVWGFILGTFLLLAVFDN